MVFVAGGVSGRVEAQTKLQIPTQVEPAGSLALLVEQLYSEGRYEESLAVLESRRGSAPRDYLACDEP